MATIPTSTLRWAIIRPSLIAPFPASRVADPTWLHLSSPRSRCIRTHPTARTVVLISLQLRCINNNNMPTPVACPMAISSNTPHNLCTVFRLNRALIRIIRTITHPMDCSNPCMPTQARSQIAHATVIIFHNQCKPLTACLAHMDNHKPKVCPVRHRTSQSDHLQQLRSPRHQR